MSERVWVMDDNNNSKQALNGLGIGDVSKICGVPGYTIRYWESEFKKELKPPRTRGRQRRYTDQDITKLLQIKKLLWVDKFSIKGARKILEKGMLISESIGLDKKGVTDTHDLAMQIAQLINDKLSGLEHAA